MIISCSKFGKHKNGTFLLKSTTSDHLCKRFHTLSSTASMTFFPEKNLSDENGKILKDPWCLRSRLVAVPPTDMLKIV